MINNITTKQKFGYNSDSLTLGSHKKVCLICDYCGRDFEGVYKNYINGVNKFKSIGLTKCCCKPCGPRKTREADDLKGTHHSKMVNADLKRKKTTLQRHGVEHISKLETFKTKVKDKWAKKTKEEINSIEEKRSQSVMKKYGVKHISENLDIRKTTKETCIKKYGVENPSQSEEVKIKRENTMFDRYGVRNFALSKDCRPKINQTWKDKYGTHEIFLLDSIQIKGKQTKIDKYGSLSPVNLGKTENKIRCWLNSFGFYFSSNISILDGKEIDMYDSNLKLGIEYCGLNWHHENSGNKDKNYHNAKLLKCREQGVRLITIFEDEWLYRENQVKGFLKSVLGINQTKVFARKCSVKQIGKQEACQFFNSYHIQGANPLGKYFAGLIHNQELVGVMSFGRHHRKQGVLVLDRLCFKEDISVAGGSSKLFKFLLNISEADSIISWSDNRWSEGNVYKNMGFIKEEELSPDYSYVYKQKRLSKQSQRKSVSDCPAELTEREWSLQRGLNRIWDCGKIRWKYTKI